MDKLVLLLLLLLKLDAKQFRPIFYLLLSKGEVSVQLPSHVNQKNIIISLPVYLTQPIIDEFPHSEICINRERIASRVAMNLLHKDRYIFPPQLV